MFRTALKLAVGATILTSAVMTTAAAQSPQPAATVTFSVRGSVAGMVANDANLNPLTYVFTEKNTGSTSAPEDLVLESITNGRSVSLGCVLPDGTVINPDGSGCEPGFVRPGQSSSSVLDLKVTGSTGFVAAKTCLFDEASDRTGPCMTLSVPI